jgi:hypothetical protein
MINVQSCTPSWHGLIIVCLDCIPLKLDNPHSHTVAPIIGPALPVKLTARGLFSFLLRFTAIRFLPVNYSQHYPKLGTNSYHWNVKSFRRYMKVLLGLLCRDIHLYLESVYSFRKTIVNKTVE